MAIFNDLSEIVERVPKSASFGSSAPFSGGPDDELVVEEHLLPSNYSEKDQTQVIKHNGSSYLLNYKFERVFETSPPRPEFRVFFRTLQKWEGYVIDVGEETFLARLIPLLGEGGDQEAEIYLEEVAPDDRELIREGSVFYWSIGYLDRPSGRIRSSVIRFRRLPSWTGKELEQADSGVTQLRDLLDSE